MAAIVAAARICAAATRDGTPVFSRDTGITPPAGDFTAFVSFRHGGYAPVPEEMAWRNGMVMCCRSGYYDGWRVLLHDGVEMRPVFEIGRREGAVSLDGGSPVSIGVWHRLAVSWRHGESPETGVMRLWLDGRLLAESPPDRPAPLVDGSSLKLGYVDFGVGALDMEAKDAVVLPKALDTEDIVRDFADCGLAGRTDLRSSYPLLAQVLDRAMGLVRRDDARRRAGDCNREPSRVVELGPGRRFVRETAFFDGPECDGLLVRGAADGSTVLDGSEEIPASAFARPSDPALLARIPVPARAKALAAEVKGLDPLRPYGIGVAHCGGLMLATTDGRLLENARWPNRGCAAAASDNGLIRFVGPAPELAPGTKFLAYGYWRYLWADAALPAEAVADGSFRLLEPHCYGLSPSPLAAIVGVPEAMDEPGEWCVVGETLLLLPPDDFTGLRVPRLGGPFFQFSNARNVRLENVRLQCSSGPAVKAQDCANLMVAGVSVSFTGGDGAVLDNCDGATVANCVFGDTGHGALVISGGDRRTLRPGNMAVEKCRFSRTGRLMRTYTPGIRLEGCGGVIADCLFEDLPSSAIRVEGNDHLIRDSTFRRTVLESDDQGAIDIWGDPSYRGNVYYRNRFEHVGGDGNEECGRAAIRLDDMISGQAVISNWFIDCARGNFGAVQMNGGNYNAVVGNVFENCARGVTIDRWDDGVWARKLAEPEIAGKVRIASENECYYRRYPEMRRLGGDQGAELIIGNDFTVTPRPVRGLSALGVFESLNTGYR